MFRFTIRELLILTVTAGLAVGWSLDHRGSEDRLTALQRGQAALQKERDTLFQMLAATNSREKAARQETHAFEALYQDARSLPGNR